MDEEFKGRLYISGGERDSQLLGIGRNTRLDGSDRGDQVISKFKPAKTLRKYLCAVQREKIAKLTYVRRSFRCLPRNH